MAEQQFDAYTFYHSEKLQSTKTHLAVRYLFG